MDDLAKNEANSQQRASQHKTIGERAYNGIQFWFVKGLILAATATIAYFARYGEETNWIRKMQVFFIDYVQKPMGSLGEWTGNQIKGGTPGPVRNWIGDKAHETIAVLGAAFASTMVLFHGGNVVAPVVQWFENHRKHIIASVNRRWVNPGDDALGNEKFKDLPKQTAGDVVKGRIMAWITVFGTFVGAFLLAGKVKGADMYRFDWYEEWFSRMTSRFSKKGAPFAEYAMHPTLDTLAKSAETSALFASHEKRLFGYRISNILAMDIYATTMGIVVWNFFSRLSAKTRTNGGSFSHAVRDRLKEITHLDKPTTSASHVDTATPSPQDAVQSSSEPAIHTYADSPHNQRQKSGHEPQDSYAKRRENERASAPETVMAAG